MVYYELLKLVFNKKKNSSSRGTADRSENGTIKLRVIKTICKNYMNFFYVLFISYI